uniref:cytochrome P450 4V2-like isoform X1 n=1 Tax=Styela clava TaxID=7725 RepID=UPI001939DE09|nr:cytochrome P450 4V2-like isoform X1 [Styela clava]
MAFSISAIVFTVVLAWLIIKTFSFFKNFVTKWKIYSKIPGPPTSYPPVGHIKLLNFYPDNIYASRIKIINDYIVPCKSNVGCIWWGPMPVLFITGPKAAEEILKSSEHLDKSYFYKFFHDWLGTGLLTATGEKWKSRRKLLTPAFHFNILKDFLPSMNDKCEIFTERLQKLANSDKYFELLEHVGLCALDIICETAMGENVNAQVDEGSEYVTSIHRITHLLMKRFKYPWMWPDVTYNLTKMGKEYRKVLNVIHTFTKSVIRDRMSKFKKEDETWNHRRHAFLDLLIKVSEGGKHLSIEDIREEVDTFMFGGHDTSSAGMTWTLYLIGTYPDVQRRIQEELDNIFVDDVDRKITFEDLRKLQYLEMVIKESHRFLPPVPIVSRNTAHDCKIDGYDVPKGTFCMIFIQLINSNPECWTNPEKFDPERFKTEQFEGRHPYSYIPFSAGPRNCIGQKFALMEEKVVLAHILRKFDVESRDKLEDIRRTGNLVLRPMDGVYVKLKNRESIE